MACAAVARQAMAAGADMEVSTRLALEAAQTCGLAAEEAAAVAPRTFCTPPTPSTPRTPCILLSAPMPRSPEGLYHLRGMGSWRGAD